MTSDQVREVVRLAANVLGADLVGIYLHGSSVLGGLKPASDVDILAVSLRTLDDEQRRALVTGLMPLSGTPVGARPVELTVVVQSEVRPWRFPPTGDFQYGEWLRAQYEAGSLPHAEPMPELALTIAITLTGDEPAPPRRTRAWPGASLVGPPPAQVLDPVPPADVVRACVAGIPALLEDLPGDTRNVVLTLARIWSTLATGTIRSKDAAADWALARLAPSHRPVLEHAKQLYLDRTYQDESWTEELIAQVGPHVEEVLGYIRRLSPPPGADRP